jgi:hypothetical protein
MYSVNVVSYKAIIDKVFRDFGWEVVEEEGVEWLAEFMAHTNVGVVMTPMLGFIHIKDGRGDLPYDLHKLEATGLLYGCTSLEQAACYNLDQALPMRWATDKFHAKYHKSQRDYFCRSAITYTVGQGYIFPSFQEGFVVIAYDAIPTDDCGYPTIPAEQQWLEAASTFIGRKLAFKMYMRNEITDSKFRTIDQERDWYFAQAVNHAKQWQNVDEAESVKNSVVRTIPSLQDHNTFFANMQMPEQRNFRPKADFGNISIVNTSIYPNPATSGSPSYP